MDCMVDVDLDITAYIQSWVYRAISICVVFDLLGWRIKNKEMYEMKTKSKTEKEELVTCAGVDWKTLRFHKFF